MAKLLIVMTDNSEWELPLGIVVSHRNNSSGGKALPGGDLIDWVRNNMDWSDLAPHATCTKPPSPPDYDALLPDAELKIQ